jgi:hypothetical protein
MPKKPKPKPRKGAKRGPKEEVLIIEDVDAAITKMWTAKKPTDKLLKQRAK